MSLQQPYIALDWVKDALDETLAQVQSALRDATSQALSDAFNGLHQVSGTLHMAQLDDTLLLSETLERALDSAISGRISFLSIQSVVNESVALLAEELDHLQRTKSSRSVALFAQVDSINKLLIHRSADAVSLVSHAKFKPDFSLLDEQFVVQPQSLEIQIKLTQAYQHFLSLWLAGDQSVPVLQGLARVAGLLQQSAQTKQQAALWQVADVFHQAIVAGQLQHHDELRSLLIRLERSLVPLDRTHAEDEELLLGDLLQALDPKHVSDPRVQQLRQLYGMELPADQGTSHLLLDSALRQVMNAREGLSVNRDTAAIALRESIRLLHVSGWTSLALDAQTQLDALLAKYVSDEAVIKGLAFDLTAFADQLQRTIDLTVLSSPVSDESLVENARHAAVRESRAALEKTKSVLAIYHQSRGDVDALEPVPELLGLVRGAFEILGLSRAANLLSASVSAIQTTVLVAGYKPHWRQVDLLAELVSSIEYYLDQLAGHYQDESILDVAEKTLAEFKQPQGQAEPVPVGGAKLYHDETTLAMLGFVEEQGDTLFNPELESGSTSDTQKNVVLEDIGAAANHLAATSSGQDFSLDNIHAEAATHENIIPPNPYKDDFGQDDEIRSIFIEEAHEVLDSIAVHYPKWKLNFKNETALKEVRRAFHTLKGSGRMVGARTVGELAWSIENLLNRILEGSIEPSNQATQLIDDVYKTLPVLVTSYTNKRLNSAEIIQHVLGAIQTAEALTQRQVPSLGQTKAIDTDEDEFLLDDSFSTDESLSDEQSQETTPAIPASVVESESPSLAPHSSTRFKKEALPLALLNSHAPQVIPSDDLVSYFGDDDAVREIFLEEAEEVLQEIAEQFPLWAVNFDNQSALEIIRRSFHTLKGSGRMVGAHVIGELSWSIERLLNAIREHTVKANQSMVQLLGEVIALIPDLVKDFSAQRAPSINVLPIVQAAWLLRDGHALSSGQVQSAVLNAVDQSADELDDDTVTSTDFDQMAALLSDSEAHLEVPSQTPPAQVAPSAIVAEEISIDELDPQLLEIFVGEAEGYLHDIQQFAMQAMSAHSDQVMVSDVLLRALHTLRGSAGMTGIESIYQLAHVMEHECKRLMREHLPINDDHIDALIELVRLTNTQLSMLKSAHMPELDATGLAFIDHVEAMSPQKDHAGEASPVFTGLVTELMDIGIDEVLDAEWTLRDHFSKPDTLTYIAIMNEQLEHLASAVVHVPIAPLNDLVIELYQTYKHLKDYPAIVDAAPQALIDDLLSAHGTLTRMFDSLAASQEVQSESDVLDVLRDWQRKVDVPADAIKPQELPKAPESTLIAEASAEVSPIASESQSSVTASLEYPVDQENDAELLEIFMEEAEELIQEIDESFSLWAANPSDSAPLKALQRHLHTLKGGARMGRVQSLGDYTHELETVYERLVEGRIQSSDILVKFLRHAQDQVAQQVDQLSQLQHSFFTPTETRALQEYIKSSNEQVLQDYFDLLELIRLAGTQKQAASIVQSTGAEPEVSKASIVSEPAVEKELPKPIEPVAAKPSMVASVVSAVASKVASVVRPNPEAPSTKAASKATSAPVTQTVDETPRLGQMQVLAEAWDEGSAPDPEVLEIFLDEAAEIINQTSLQLTEWLALVSPESGQAQDNPKSKLLLKELQRNLHTFKGGARMAGVTALGDLSHEMEFVYEDLALGKTPVTLEIGQLLNQSHDWLADSIAILDRGERPQMPQVLIDALRLFRKNPASLVGAKIEILQAVVNDIQADVHVDEPVASLKVSMTDHVVTEPKVNSGVVADLPPIEGAFPKLDTLDVSSSEMVRVSANLMDKMINLVGENAINRARIEMGLTGVAQIVDEMGATIKRIAEQLRRMDGELESQIIARHQEDLGSLSSGQYQDFDPLEMDQYSSINQLSKSLAESVSDLLDFKNTLVEKARDSESLLLQQSRIQSELQEGLMSSRLVPFSRLVPRLQRVVRQTATELGKSVNLVIQNAEGELDRSVLERMIAPLEHMLRNAVDHGLESANDRIKQKKSEKGTITLSVQREGSEVILTLQDDGAGIHVEAVRNRAIERGIINASAELTEHEIMQLIFHAGLSTAKQVTQISGRGVGMDVVQSEIRQLGGVVTVDSVEGQGTTFTLRLPLTVAVTDALRVRVGDRIFAISLSQIERIVRVSPDELAKFYGSQQELFDFSGKPYRLRYLGELIGGQTSPTLYGQILPLPLLIVKYEGQQVAIQVDQLVGSREEIVIKPVGLQLASVSSISGATILGDGSVVIILDLAALARIAASQTRVNTTTIREVVETPLTSAQQKKVIMVVDDSVTVRKVTTRLLERQGYQVVQAKDGVDAMSKLEEVHPDLMLLDIEMPRMDGFEVANLVRHNPRLSELPIIMITSRTGEKHRERAFSAGVNGYMGKPFQEQILLENIAELLAESQSAHTTV